ncbi:MAG: hypothetical protein ACO1NQ_09670 [Flavobacteriales bacterium]
MDVKGAIADHMGHFSVHDIPNVLFMVIVATAFGYATARLGARVGAPEGRALAGWAALAALAAVLVRSQLPLAALVLAAAILVGKRPSALSEMDLLAMLLIGIGCGSGASVIVGILLVLFIPIMRWSKNNAPNRVNA